VDIRSLVAVSSLLAACACPRPPAATPAEAGPPAPEPTPDPAPPEPVPEAAPAAAPAPRSPATPLAKRLGGREGIARVVHATLERVAADRRTAGMLAGHDRAALEARMTAHLCTALNAADCEAGAATLEAGDWGARVDDRAFDAFLEHLGAAMAELGVGEVDQNELLAVVGPWRASVVRPR
jgi:truncated hemoglobin YjbI